MRHIVTDRKHTSFFESFFVAALVGQRIALRAWELEQRLPKMTQVVTDRKHTRIFDTFFVGGTSSAGGNRPCLPPAVEGTRLFEIDALIRAESAQFDDWAAAVRRCFVGPKAQNPGS